MVSSPLDWKFHLDDRSLEANCFDSTDNTGNRLFASQRPRQRIMNQKNHHKRLEWNSNGDLTPALLFTFQELETAQGWASR